MSATSTSVRRVEEALGRHGMADRIRHLPDSTRSAADAAAAVGCEVAAIAKSLVFRRKAAARPLLVIASGAQRADEAAIAALIGEAIGKADAQFVRDTTGFAIGGVAPVGHTGPIRILIDETLMALPEIWAAAGTPHSVFNLTPAELVKITGGTVAAIAARA